MVFKELDPDLNYILQHDHDYRLHDLILGFILGYYQLFCDPDFTQAQGFSIYDI